MLTAQFSKRSSDDSPNPFTGRRVHDLELEPVIPSPDRFYAEKRERLAAAQAAREATAAETIARADDRARIAALETEVAELWALVARLRTWVGRREHERTSER